MMAATAGEQPKLKVFVSYAREDLAFADQLVDGLRVAGFEPLIDRHRMTGGEEFKNRLGALILECDTVCFVVTPDSIRPQSFCAWEIEEADRLSKRVIPVLCRPLGSVPVPERLKALDYIFFYAEPHVPGSGFGNGLARLSTALRADLAWLREHTMLGERATRWALRGRDSDSLLRGKLLADAEQLLADRPVNAPDFTQLQRDYLRESRLAEDAVLSAERERAELERQRLLEMEAAQQARAAALAEAEKAVRQRDDEQMRRQHAEQRRARLRRLLMAVTAAGVVGLAGFSYFLVERTREARSAQASAVEAAARAEAQRNIAADALKEAQRTQRETIASYWVNKLQGELRSGRLGDLGGHTRLLRKLKGGDDAETKQMLKEISQEISKRGVQFDSSQTAFEHVIDDTFKSVFANFFSRKPKYVLLEAQAAFASWLLFWDDKRFEALAAMIDALLEPDAPDIFDRYKTNSSDKDREFMVFVRDLFTALLRRDGTRFANHVSSPYFNGLLVRQQGFDFDKFLLSDVIDWPSRLRYIISRAEKLQTSPPAGVKIDQNEPFDETAIARAFHNATLIRFVLYDAVIAASDAVDPKVKERAIEFFEERTTSVFDYDRSSTIPRLAAALRCHNPALAMKHASALRHQKKFAEAVAVYDTLKIGHRRPLAAIVGVAEAWAQARDAPAMLAAWRELATTWPKERRRLVETVAASAARFLDGASGEAVRRFISETAELVTDNPDIAWGLRRGVAHAAHEAGEHELAFELTRQPLVEPPDGQVRHQRMLLSWYGLFVRRFDDALQAGRAALAADPKDFMVEGNLAHALMFLGQPGDARAIYQRNAKEQIGRRDWNLVLSEDFDLLRKAGLTHPLMDELQPDLPPPPPKATEPSAPSFTTIEQEGPGPGCAKLVEMAEAERVKAVEAKAAEERLLAERRAEREREAAEYTAAAERRAAEAKANEERAAEEKRAFDERNAARRARGEPELMWIPDWLRGALDKPAEPSKGSNGGIEANDLDMPDWMKRAEPEPATPANSTVAPTSPPPAIAAPQPPAASMSTFVTPAPATLDPASAGSTPTPVSPTPVTAAPAASGPTQTTLDMAAPAARSAVPAAPPEAEGGKPDKPQQQPRAIKHERRPRTAPTPWVASPPPP